MCEVANMTEIQSADFKASDRLSFNLFKTLKYGIGIKLLISYCQKVIKAGMPDALKIHIVVISSYKLVLNKEF